MMEVVKKKVCLLGDPAVGKTSLIKRFVLDRYDDKYLSTLGTKISKKIVTINELKKSITLMIWDLTGQPEFHQVHVAAFKKSSGALVVGDMTRKSTVDNMEKWVATLYETERDIPVMLLVNKSDLTDFAEVDEEYVKTYAARLDLDHLFTSAKTGRNVEEAFERMGRLLLGADEKRAPRLDKKVVAEAKERPKGKELLHIEDKLVSEFCEMIGNTDFGMSILRNQFQKAGVDFNNPTLEGLRAIAEQLLEVIKVFKGEDEAKRAKKELAKILVGGTPHG